MIPGAERTDNHADNQPSWWTRRLLARAQADAVRITARERAQAEAGVLRAEADVVAVTAADLALQAEHDEWLRQHERDDAEQLAALNRARVAAEVVPAGRATSAADQGDRLWAVVLTIPLLTGSTAAMFGQVASLHPRLVGFVGDLGITQWRATATALAVALAVGVTLETLGLFMARLAHKARLRGDSPAIYRAAMWTIVLYAAGVNYHEWSPSWTQPSMLGVLFASLSIASVLGWELREHRADRDRRAAEIDRLGWTPTPIPPRPEFGAMRWLVAPEHTFAAWRVAVQDRIPDAVTALARADEILAARRTATLELRAERRGAEQPAPARPRRVFARRLRKDDEETSRYDVDVFADDLPVPTTREAASSREAPALPPSSRPPATSRPKPPALPRPDREAPAATVREPASREGRVLPIGASRSEEDVLAAIQEYHDREDRLPTANWLKTNLSIGPTRAGRLLAKVQDEDRKATG